MHAHNCTMAFSSQCSLQHSIRQLGWVREGQHDIPRGAVLPGWSRWYRPAWASSSSRAARDCTASILSSDTCSAACRHVTCGMAEMHSMPSACCSPCLQMRGTSASSFYGMLLLSQCQHEGQVHIWSGLLPLCVAGGLKTTTPSKSHTWATAARNKSTGACGASATSAPTLPAASIHHCHACGDLMHQAGWHALCCRSGLLLSNADIQGRINLEPLTSSHR